MKFKTKYVSADNYYPKIVSIMVLDTANMTEKEKKKLWIIGKARGPFNNKQGCLLSYSKKISIDGIKNYQQRRKKRNPVFENSIQKTSVIKKF